MLISCRHYVSLVTEAREGVLGRWDRARFKLHGTICIYCRGYERGFRATLELLRDQPPEPPDERLQQELVARLRATRG